MSWAVIDPVPGPSSMVILSGSIFARDAIFLPKKRELGSIEPVKRGFAKKRDVNVRMSEILPFIF